MKHLFTSLFLTCWVSLFSFAQTIQGDGGLPKTYKETLITKDIDTWVFEQPDISALQTEDAINDLKGEAPWRFGYNNYTELNLNNSGTWIETVNGSKIWRVVTTVKGVAGP